MPQFLPVSAAEIDKRLNCDPEIQGLHNASVKISAYDQKRYQVAMLAPIQNLVCQSLLLDSFLGLSIPKSHLPATVMRSNLSDCSNSRFDAQDWPRPNPISPQQASRTNLYARYQLCELHLQTDKKPESLHVQHHAPRPFCQW